MGDAGTLNLTPRGALDSYRDRLAALEAVHLDVLPLARHYNLRVDGSGPSALAVEAVLGAQLPGALSWASAADGSTVVWLGPDEWLVLAASDATDIEAALRSAVGDDGAVVEQSGQRLSLVVSGDAYGLLAKGTGLDLRPSAFPEGTALQGFLGQAVVVYLSRADDGSRVELLVRTSFARYVADWLLDAAADPLAYPADVGR
jgi:sarcosine oxidase, subunit gamma